MPLLPPRVHRFRRARRASPLPGVIGAFAGLRSLALRFAVGCSCAGLAVGCGDDPRPSPFVEKDGSVTDAATDSGEGAADAAPPFPEAGPSRPEGGDAEWGGPCLDDGECDDGAECTADRCEGARCHFVPDATKCDDGEYCDGEEECVPKVGCRPGEPVACSDGTACTIDECVEATHSCTHVPRDADGDGDPDGNCPDGHDCNDTDPAVSSVTPEICENTVDDDCDGTADEADCEAPEHDTCVDALEVTSAGAFSLSARAARLDYAASCVSSTSRMRDLVAAVHVPEGDPVDVDLALTSTSGSVGLAAATACGDASSEVLCEAGATVNGQGVSRLVLRGLAPGAYPVYLFTESLDELKLVAGFPSPTAAPTNETCGTADVIVSGTPVIARLAGAAVDLETACGTTAGDLVYSFNLTETSDVHAYAAPRDTYGTPILSLRSRNCTDLGSELTCAKATNADVFRRALPPDRYFLVVGATGPSDLDVVLETGPPTVAPADDGCAAPPRITPNVTRAVDFSGHEDDIHDGCSVGRVDAAYELSLSERSDVLLVETMSDGDQGAVSLADATCSDALVCNAVSAGTLRVSRHGVEPGEYRVVAESAARSPVTLTAFTRPETAPVLVAFADGCSDAVAVPESGGFFQGNTANVSDDFTAGCDVGGYGGSPDQLLHLVLGARKRVVLDARGSNYGTVLDVRAGAACPGTEVEGACSAGYERDGSYIDTVLDPGDYWLQVDGYGNDSGAWALEVFVAPG